MRLLPAKTEALFQKHQTLAYLGGSRRQDPPFPWIPVVGLTNQHGLPYILLEREVMALGRKHLRIKALTSPMQQGPLSTSTLIKAGLVGRAVWAQGLGQFPLELPRRQN